MTEPREKTRRERPRLRAETVSTAPTVLPPGEVHEEGGRLVGSFFLPYHSPAEVKYHVGRRTITLWSRKDTAEFQTILVLPKWVNPETFILRHKNGVYEFLLEEASKPAGLNA